MDTYVLHATEPGRGAIPASASETPHSAGQQKGIFLTAALSLGAPHGGLFEVVLFCSEFLCLGLAQWLWFAPCADSAAGRGWDKDLRGGQKIGSMDTEHHRKFGKQTHPEFLLSPQINSST